MKNHWTKHHNTKSGQSAQLRTPRARPEPEQPLKLPRDPNAPKVDSMEAMRSRIPGMSLEQLTSFRANAARIAEQSGDKKQEQAAELLPQIEAEIEVRKAARTVMAADKRKATATRRSATVARRKRETEAAERVAEEQS
jgi:hypothetical protein